MLLTPCFTFHSTPLALWRGVGGEAFRQQNYASPHLPANYWYILLVFVTKVWVDGMNGMKM